LFLVTSYIVALQGLAKALCFRFPVWGSKSRLRRLKKFQMFPVLPVDRRLILTEPETSRQRMQWLRFVSSSLFKNGFLIKSRIFSFTWTAFVQVLVPG
jgi:hypothetical protein